MKNIFKKKEILIERAVEYDPQHSERMHPSTERTLANRSHYLGAHPAFPPSVGDQHFEEKIASERFKDAVNTARRYGNIQNIRMDTAAQKLMDNLYRAMDIEKQGNNKKRLEQLAINLVKRELNISGDKIDFIAELSSGITTAGVPKMPKKEKGEIEMEFEDTKELEDVEDEVKKRRLVNSLIQGASKKGHYMFHQVERELRNIDPNLVNYYGNMMSFNDLVYWFMGDDQIRGMSSEGTTQAGRVNIGTAGDENDPREKNEIPKESLRNQKYYVYARGIVFPALVHELIKGAMEILSLSSLPEYENEEKTQKIQQYIMDRADFLDAETWDIRLGPGLWEKFLDAIGENDFDIKEHLYSQIMRMPANEFHSFMKELFAGTRRGKEKLAKLAADIKRDIIHDRYEEEEYKRNMSQIEKEVEDTSDDLLSQLGDIKGIQFGGYSGKTY